MPLQFASEPIETCLIGSFWSLMAIEIFPYYGQLQRLPTQIIPNLFDFADKSECLEYYNVDSSNTRNVYKTVFDNQISNFIKCG